MDIEEVTIPFWVAGEPRTSDTLGQMVSPRTGTSIARFAIPSDEDVEDAVVAALAVAKELREVPTEVRAKALSDIANRLEEVADEVAAIISAETGKPAMWARGETRRAIATFRIAAKEVLELHEVRIDLESDKSGRNRVGLINRFPRGPILGIAPFNFPLNLVVHKLAPAIAVGAPIIIKPSPRTPASAEILARIVSETQLPAGCVSVLPVGAEATMRLVDDPRLPVVSFTGSDVVGAEIVARVPDKHITLELGGDAAVVVCEDFSTDEDLDWAAERIATFANYQAGQSCISVQRVFVHQKLAEDLTARIVNLVGSMDAESEDSIVGPVIDVNSANRIQSWIDEATSSGAEVLCGGTSNGTYVQPTILRNVAGDSMLARNEVFGPVLYLDTFDDVDEALALVNHSRFGLQCGVFTHDLEIAYKAQRDLDVGGLIVGDVPSFRADEMPYGGVKDSGRGREGVKSAMFDYTEERSMILTDLDG